MPQERTAFDEKERQQKAISSLTDTLGLMDMEEILDMKLLYEGCIATIEKAKNHELPNEADRHNMDFMAAFFCEMAQALDRYLKQLKDGEK